MKKFILMMVAAFATLTMNAQTQTNYAGSSRFTDNWSVTLQGGIVTPASHFFTDGSTTPVVVLGFDKYITPWFGFGLEGRTSIGTGESYNIHTAFDLDNVSGYFKVNLANLFAFNGTRRFFEPVIYTGLGWGHVNCSEAQTIDQNYNWEAATIIVNGQPASIGVPTEQLGWTRNFLTYRAGVELNFNLGKTKAWGVVVNPSFVWGNVDNFRLDKRCGNFEITAGIVYHFKNSNGKHHFTTVEPIYVEKPVEKVVEKVVEKTVTHEVTKAPEVNSWIVKFGFDSAELTSDIKDVLNSIPAGKTVDVYGYASYDGKDQTTYNQKLSEARAEVVTSYLKSRKVKVNSSCGKGASDEGRVAIVIAE